LRPHGLDLLAALVQRLRVDIGMVTYTSLVGRAKAYAQLGGVAILRTC
jgi:hypothetical protein